ncbi:MAG: hypothetical protein GY717_21495 [Rhodobacteraceae bacterium]|nr:hypothetical protein [Paracoccaceae bacterium]
MSQTLILSTATLCAVYWYVFEQDWVMALLFGEYMGWAYLGLVTFCVAVLTDVALNRARATTRGLNLLFNMLGVPATLMPC